MQLELDDVGGAREQVETAEDLIKLVETYFQTISM